MSERKRIQTNTRHAYVTVEYTKARRCRVPGMITLGGRYTLSGGTPCGMAIYPQNKPLGEFLRELGITLEDCEAALRTGTTHSGTE